MGSPELCVFLFQVFDKNSGLLVFQEAAHCQEPRPHRVSGGRRTIEDPGLLVSLEAAKPSRASASSCFRRLSNYQGFRPPCALGGRQPTKNAGPLAPQEAVELRKRSNCHMAPQDH